MGRLHASEPILCIGQLCDETKTISDIWRCSYNVTAGYAAQLTVIATHSGTTRKENKWRARNNFTGLQVSANVLSHFGSFSLCTVIRTLNMWLKLVFILYDSRSTCTPSSRFTLCKLWNHRTTIRYYDMEPVRKHCRDMIYLRPVASTTVPSKNPKQVCEQITISTSSEANHDESS